MASANNDSVYQINKGINAAIQFKGLQAQYIWYMGGATLLLMIFYAILYVCGVNSFACIGIITAVGIPLIMAIYYLSGTYGKHGLIKLLAARSIPKTVKSRSRMMFKKQNIYGKAA